MADVVHNATGAPAHEHGHDHPSYLAHHFDTPVQQFDAGKLGMWLFLATEILLFGGLFCAYAIYRANHPEVFEYAHRFLDTKWGAINTVVLLASSFTMAWGVTAAQQGKKVRLSFLLALTFLGGVGFMVIKGIEYTAKFQHGTLWGLEYDQKKVDHAAHELGLPYKTLNAGDGHGESASQEPAAAEHAPADAAKPAASAEHAAAPVAAATEPPKPAATPAAPASANVAPEDLPVEASSVALAPPGPSGLSHHELEDVPKNVQWFFGIYFAMTGLHGLHVLAGMVVIAWLFLRSVRGDFSAEYFTPVDLGGLYWHLVDLIWIYLFPLLYLIT